MKLVAQKLIKEGMNPKDVFDMPYDLVVDVLREEEQTKRVTSFKDLNL